MSKINIGIIGRNFGLKVIYRGLSSIKSFNVLGISCKNKLLRKNIPDKLKIYKSWKELISDKKLDAIVISSPPKTHKKIIKFAIKKNKHIFCDKPVTASFKEISYICNLLKNKKICNFVNYEFVNIEAFKIFKKKYLNKIGLNKICVNWHLNIPLKKRASWKDSHALGGGYFFNYICHILFYIENMIGKINLENSYFETKKNSFLLNTETSIKNKKIKINISFRSNKNQGLSKPIHEIIFFTNKGFYKLKTDINSLYDQFYLYKNNKQIFKPKKINHDFRLKPTTENLKKFKENLINPKKKGPNFIVAKRIHYLIKHFYKR